MIGDSDDARGVPLPETNGVGLSRPAVDRRRRSSAGRTGRHRPERSPSPRSGCSVTRASRRSTVWAMGRADVHASPTIFDQRRLLRLQADSTALRVDTIFDVGPLGLWPNAAHGHADALSLIIRVNDELLLGDPGPARTSPVAPCATGFGAPPLTTRSRGRPRSGGHVRCVQVGEPDARRPDRVLHRDTLDYACRQARRVPPSPEGVTHYRHVLFVRPCTLGRRR